MDCNDEPLLEHIEELLSEINTKIASKTESLQDKDKDEKTNFPGDQRIETMDTMS